MNKDDVKYLVLKKRIVEEFNEKLNNLRFSLNEDDYEQELCNCGLSELWDYE